MNDLRVEPGSKGNWKIEEFVVSEDDARFFNLRDAIKGQGRGIEPGTYVRLLRTNSSWATTVMSNTPAEIADHEEFIWNAKGHVLVAGLGLGVVLQMLLEKTDVKKITVVEISEDLIDLVGPYFNDERIEIIQADIFEYQPPRGIRYGAVWFDIWDHICSDNLKEIYKLERKYRRRSDWVGSWCKEECKRYY